jgi:hypothetical protein
MWVRIAARFPVWYEPRPLALYRMRPGSLIASSMRSARNVRDARRNIELMRRHVPSGSERAAVRRARRRCADWGLKNAASLVGEGDLRGAAAQVREALLASPAGAATSLALTAVRLSSDGSMDTLELGPGGRSAPAPSEYRRRIPARPEGELRPRWSVMIPAYECAGYLRETLASVLAQDPGPDRMQIEVVDDASSDDPEAVVEELGRGRVGFFRQPVNVGHTANFNTCLERARGELVHLLHGDDCVREGFYEAMERPFLEHPDLGAAFCRYIAMDAQGHWQNIALLEQPTAGVIPDWLGRIALGQRLQFPSMVVARATYERLGGFDSRPSGLGEDWEMWVRVAAHYPVAYEPRPLALYRVHPLSQSGGLLRSGENARDLRRVITINGEHFDEAIAEEIARKALRATALGCVRRSRRLLAAGDVTATWAQLREALRSDRSPQVVAGAALVAAGRVAAAVGLIGTEERLGR